MSLRSSHLMTLTISVTWVSRLMSLLNRWERSPRPVRVGENTLWPFFSRRSATRRQYQAPTHAPWISTNVLLADCARGRNDPAAHPREREACGNAADQCPAVDFHGHNVPP